MVDEADISTISLLLIIFSSSQFPSFPTFMPEVYYLYSITVLENVIILDFEGVFLFNKFKYLGMPPLMQKLFLIMGLFPMILRL